MQFSDGKSGVKTLYPSALVESYARAVLFTHRRNHKKYVVLTLHLGVNGGYTAWSQPGACSKSCGKGVRYRTRSCTNPKPSYDGRNCVGPAKEIHPYWCNSQVNIQNSTKAFTKLCIGIEYSITLTIAWSGLSITLLTF
jgi:hypothetical protein